MVNLTIDGLKVSVPEGTTIMQAAATVGIDIPRLCFLKDINEISACKVCVVEIQGQNRVVTSCTTPVQEGLVVYTNSPKARSVRRTNVELILPSMIACAQPAFVAVTAACKSCPMIWAFSIYPLSARWWTPLGTRIFP